MSDLKKIWFHLKKVLLFFRRYYFGFVRGHSYMSESLINKIEADVDGGMGKEIVSQFEKYFAAEVGEGAAISFATGRMAFYALMKSLGIGSSDEVILLGFTCSVMPNAVLRTGAAPVFADVDPDTFGSTAETIAPLITPRTKMIVAQHTFGIPCQIESIKKLAKERGIFLLEDCALTVGSTYKGLSVGNWGDAAIFSTDYSKPLNTIFGGLLYSVNTDIIDNVKSAFQKLPELPISSTEIIRELRKTRYWLKPDKFPKYLALESISLLLSKLKKREAFCQFFTGDYLPPVAGSGEYPYPAEIPAILARLGLEELKYWKDEQIRRTNIFSEYLNIAVSADLREYLPQSYFDDNLQIIPLRFVFTKPDRNNIFCNAEAKFNIDGSWFKQPIISAPQGPESLGYIKGSCPVAESIGQLIVNFPCVVTPGWENKMIEEFKNVCKDSS